MCAATARRRQDASVNLTAAGTRPAVRPAILLAKRYKREIIQMDPQANASSRARFADICAPLACAA
jgi:hypothetical protein